MADELNASVSEIRKRYRFLLSSFTQEERQELTKAIIELGGSCSDSSHYTVTCTHIVSKKPNRGEKFLCGSAAGKWILRREYIDNSIKAKRWLDEESYEWNDQCSYNGLPKGHISAPCRWRKELLISRTGPFHDWKALVILKDTKKRNAYRSLLEIGQATVLNAKPPYHSSLIQKATHVFVEKALEDEVQCFAHAGIPCLSPDYIPEYILQDPKPNMEDFYISMWSASTVVSTMKRSISSRQITPLFPAGECGIPKTKSRMIDSKPGCEKRQIKLVVDENQLPPAKKPKQVKQVFPKWLECYSGDPLLNDFDQAFPRKVSKDVSIFPSHVMEAIENYLEEDERIAVSVMKSFLSSTRYPSPFLVSTIMNRLLLKASSPQLANASCSVLQLLLTLHPPPVRSSLYYQAMCSPTLTSDREIKLTRSAWEYLSMIFRQSLGLSDGTTDGTKEKTTSLNNKQDQTRNTMLMMFLCSVFENDFCGLMGSKDTKIKDIDRCRKTLTWKVFWPDGILAVNCAVRELLKLTWISASQSHQDSCLFPVLRYLQEMLSMVATCFEIADQSIMGDHHSYGIEAGSWMMSLATEMVLTCGRSHKQEDGLRIMLQSLQPIWLKVQVLDIMLSSYNDCLVPAQYKSLLAGELSLEKIVSCYFYLLPVVNTLNQDDVIEHVDKTKNDNTRSSVLTLITDANRYNGTVEQLNRTPEKTKKNPLNKRNKKGETPLHIAAIKNDPARIKELINAGVDVNLTDNAGWTPLHEACNHGNIKCVEEILKVRPLLYKPTQKGLAGLDIMISPACGTTPLHDAVVNNHIDVAKALISAGGLPLLQAKTSDGKTPADLSCSQEMVTYLKTTEKSLTDMSTEHNLSTQQRRTHKNNSDNAYRKVLGPRGSRTAKHISPEKCQEYVLLLSQLLQGFSRLQGENIDAKIHDREMINHVNGLKRHLQAITIDSQLTVICKTRLENMTLL